METNTLSSVRYFKFDFYLWAEGKDVRWWNAGSPKHLSLCWLWAIQGPCESAVSWNVSFLVAEVWLKPISDSAWIPFNLQEHKIHNNVSFFFGRFELLVHVFRHKEKACELTFKWIDAEWSAAQIWLQLWLLSFYKSLFYWILLAKNMFTIR